MHDSLVRFAHCSSLPASIPATTSATSAASADPPMPSVLNRRHLQAKIELQQIFKIFLILAIVLFTTVLYQSHANANVVGIGSQNFNPTPDGLDFVTVQSANTLEPGIMNFGLFVNNAWNTLPFIDSATQSHVKLNDTLLGLDVNLGIGLAKDWEIGLSLPAVLSQSVQNQGDIHGQFTQSGSTEVRVNTKYRIMGDRDWGLAALGTINFDRVIDDPYAGNGSGPAFTLELATDRSIGRYVIGFNLGRRFRQPGTPIAGAVVEPLRDQWIASIALSRFLIDYNTKLIAEIFTAAPAQSAAPNETRSQTSAELLLGAKYDWSTQLALHFGGASGIVRGVSSPDWRVYAGLNYAFGPIWSRHEKVAPIEPELDIPSDDPPPAKTYSEQGNATSEPLPPSRPVEAFRIGNLLFEFNSAEMAAGFEDMLSPLVERLKSRPFKHLKIEGYTDSVGRRAYNLDLSRRRAESVRKYLINVAHLPARKMEAAGFGPDNPIASNSNYQGRQANRRVEFKIDR